MADVPDHRRTFVHLQLGVRSEENEEGGVVNPTPMRNDGYHKEVDSKDYSELLQRVNLWKHEMNRERDHMFALRMKNSILLDRLAMLMEDDDSDSDDNEDVERQFDRGETSHPNNCSSPLSIETNNSSVE